MYKICCKIYFAPSRDVVSIARHGAILRRDVEFAYTSAVNIVSSVFCFYRAECAIYFLYVRRTRDYVSVHVLPVPPFLRIIALLSSKRDTDTEIGTGLRLKLMCEHYARRESDNLLKRTSSRK